MHNKTLMINLLSNVNLPGRDLYVGSSTRNIRPARPRPIERCYV
jgi:hypothetical protein